MKNDKLLLNAGGSQHDYLINLLLIKIKAEMYQCNVALMNTLRNKKCFLIFFLANHTEFESFIAFGFIVN